MEEGDLDRQQAAVGRGADHNVVVVVVDCMVLVRRPPCLSLRLAHDHTHAPAGVEVAAELDDPLKRVVVVLSHTKTNSDLLVVSLGWEVASFRHTGFGLQEIAVEGEEMTENIARVIEYYLEVEGQAGSSRSVVDIGSRTVVVEDTENVQAIDAILVRSAAETNVEDPEGLVLRSWPSGEQYREHRSP